MIHETAIILGAGSLITAAKGLAPGVHPIKDTPDGDVRYWIHVTDADHWSVYAGDVDPQTLVDVDDVVYGDIGADYH